MALTSASAPDFVAAPQSIGGVQVRPNQKMFWLKTETNHDPIRTVAVDSPVFGRTARWDLPKKGYHTQILVSLDVAVTVAENGGTVTAKDKWADGAKGLLDRLQYRVQSTDVHSVSGFGLNALKHVDYGDVDLSVIEEGLDDVDLTTDGTYEARIAFLVPIAKDQGTDIAGILAESDGTTLEMLATFAAKQDLFTFTGSADVTMTCSINYQLTWRDLPRDSVDGQPVIWVPDTSRVMMIHEQTRDIVATGNCESPILRSNGNLHRIISWIRNNNANVDPRTLDYVKFGYGVNQTPRLHSPVHHLLMENALNYRSPLPHDAFAFDFDAQNPVRDATRPRSVTEMLVQAGIPSSVTLSGAKFHTVQQNIISARNSTAVVVPDVQG